MAVYIHLKDGAGKAWAGHKRFIEMLDDFLIVELDDSDGNLGALLPVGSDNISIIETINFKSSRDDIA